MIRWILGIILVIVLILAIVFVFRSFNSGSEDDTNVEGSAEVAEGGNLAPVVIGDSFSTSAGQPVQGNVLNNDTDPQNEILTVNTMPVNGPTNGTLTLNADGTFVYTPGAGYVGVDSFTYEACDASNNCTTGTVQITINSSGETAAVDDESSSEGGESVPETSPPSSEDSAEPDVGGDAIVDSAGNGGMPADTESAEGGADSSDASTLPPANVAGQSVGESATHVIKQGEWLIQIARCYGTSPESIRNQNYIPYPGWIMPGESLTIPDVGSVSEPFLEPCIMFYTVKDGDTLYSIAQAYQVELDMLLKANYGCYGYGYYYHPPIPTPYDGQISYQHQDGWYMHPWYGYGPGYGAHSPYIYNGCYFPSYYNPIIYVGQELVIPVNLENTGMRP